MYYNHQIFSSSHTYGAQITPRLLFSLQFYCLVFLNKRKEKKMDKKMMSLCEVGFMSRQYKQLQMYFWLVRRLRYPYLFYVYRYKKK